MAFTLDIKNIGGFFERLATLENNLTQGVDDELDTSAEQIAMDGRKNLTTQGAFDEGTLAGRINVERSEKLKRGIGANAFWAPYIEFGTKGKAVIPAGLEDYASQFKGKGSGNFTQLIAAIAAWVKRKGIKTGTYNVKTRRRLGNKATKQREDDGLVWAIAMSIWKKGIRPRPFMFPAFNDEKPKLLKRITDLLLK